MPVSLGGGVGDPGPKQCHPRVGRSRPAHGCLPVELLKEAAKVLRLKAAKNPVALRKALENHLNVPPEREYSFLQALPLSPERKLELARMWLRPKKPDAWGKDPDMWLDSTNISAVMNQFEESNSEFEFMGPFPIDFAAPDPYTRSGGGGQKQCLMNEMCELRVLDAKKNGTKYIGIVYNLDPHFKSGSHWVANFIDLKSNTCHYFDSYGMEPPKQIAAFMKWLAKQDPNMRLHYNPKRLQYKNTECGMYCLLFNTLMQYGTEFVKIPRAKPSDQEVMDLRDWFYST
jgi:hypothetical protein